MSRHVLGSGTTILALSFISRSAATGLGPRAIIVVFLSALLIFLISNFLDTAFIRARVPTPVIRITMSKLPAINSLANFKASFDSDIGTSLIEGATRGTPH